MSRAKHRRPPFLVTSPSSLSIQHLTTASSPKPRPQPHLSRSANPQLPRDKKTVRVTIGLFLVRLTGCSFSFKSLNQKKPHYRTLTAPIPEKNTLLVSSKTPSFLTRYHHRVSVAPQRGLQCFLPQEGHIWGPQDGATFSLPRRDGQQGLSWCPQATSVQRHPYPTPSQAP